MEILHFIFLLGINFVIFEFIWGILNIFTSMIIGTFKSKYPQIDYILRIIKYFLLVAVTARFIFITSENHDLIHSENVKIVTSAIVLGLYLLGKLQKREMFSRFNMINSNMVKGFTTYFDPKVEKFLVIGSLLFFIACLVYPGIVDRGIINWFTNSILNLSSVFFFGFIFKVIAFFFIINIFTRAGNIIGNLLQGKPLNYQSKRNNNPFNPGGFNQQKNKEPEFTDYEEIEDDKIE